MGAPETTAALKVLYIDGVGSLGGASRSLHEVLSALPEGSVDSYFVVQRGTILTLYGMPGNKVIATRGLTRFDHTRFSYYRGLRWLITLRELLYLPFTFAALLKARRLWPDIDLIHVNEITEIIPGLIAKRLFRAPMIIHIRSLQVVDRRMLRTRWVHRRLRWSAAALIAIDENVRARLPADMPVTIIHNAFSPKPAGVPDEAYIAQLDQLREGSLKVGSVGNLHRSKGIEELLEAARLVKQAGGDVQYLIVGGATHKESGLLLPVLNALGLAQNIGCGLRKKVKEYGLERDFLFLGPTGDLQRIYSHMDVVAFPSHFNSPGRPVFEAGFFGVPSIVAVDEPRNDTLMNGETGLAIDRPDPGEIADAILHFERNRSEVRRMGENARALAHRNFMPATNALKLLMTYLRVVDSGRHKPTQADGLTSH